MSSLYAENESENIFNCDSDLWISDLLINIGILPNLSGYYQIKNAVYIAANSPELVNIKDIYKKVAKNYNTFEQNVERNIRNAITVSYKENSLIRLNNILKVDVVKSENHFLSNSQLISLLAHYIKQKFCPPAGFVYVHTPAYCQ